jgi:hypothetical protein
MLVVLRFKDLVQRLWRVWSFFALGWHFSKNVPEVLEKNEESVYIYFK